MVNRYFRYVMRITILTITFLCSYNVLAHNYKILNEHEQNNTIFTQGLDLEDQHLYLSSGLYGKSAIYRYKQKKHEFQLVNTWHLPRHYFAEGTVKVDDQLYLLTWKAGLMFILDAEKLTLKSSQSYQGQGWGLTHDGSNFVMSNGSDTLYFRDSESFDITNTLQVTHNGKALQHLNELEYACGAIWANIWFSDDIVKIDPKTGHVQDSWNMKDLRKTLALTDPQAVLNGIAYDEKQSAFWITGKFWPKRYLVAFDNACEKPAPIRTN